MPLKFRSQLGEKFVITKGLDKCLWIFSDEQFRELDKRLSSLLDPNAVRLQRFFSAEAVDAVADTQGRFAIPANLREYAGIDREAMLVGAVNRIEIWGRERWEKMNEAVTDEMITAAAKEVGIG